MVQDSALFDLRQVILAEEEEQGDQEQEEEHQETDQQAPNGGDPESPTQSSPPANLKWKLSSSSLTALDDMIPADRISMLDLMDSFPKPVELTRKLNSTVRKRGEQFKDLALRHRDRVFKTGEEDLDKLRKQTLKLIDSLEKRLSNEQFVPTAEKFTFAFGVLNVLLLGYIMGHRPDLFHIVYTAELAALLPIRFYTYRRREWHYYLADLCYYVNLLCVLFVWVFPSSEELYISCFALTYGTLCFAVITWRNSLVLHSLEKTTSTFIHVLPPTVMHVITHLLPPSFKHERFPSTTKLANWKFFSGLLWTSVAYFIWQSLYHYFITICRSEKIRAGRVTSFEFLRKAYAKKPLGKFVNSLPGTLPVVAFTLIQFAYQLGTMILCPLWYSSKELSTGFLLTIFFVASYNGATYYIDIFGKRFQKELLHLEAEVAKLQQKQ